VQAVRRFVFVFAFALLLLACDSRAGANEKQPLAHFDCGAHYYGPTAWRATSDGKTLVTLGDENGLRVWDTATGKLTRTLWLPRAAGSKNADPKLWLSPDGKLAAVPYSTPEEPRGKLALVPLDDSGTYRVIGGEVFEVTEVAFSPNGKFVATAAGRPPVNVWDTATGKSVAVLNFDPDLRATGIAFSPDGKKIAVGLPMVNFNELKKSVIAIHDAASGKWESQFPREGHTRPVWSPDGKLLLVTDTGFEFDVFTVAGERKAHFRQRSEVRLAAVGFDAAGRCVSVIHTKTGLRARDELTGRALIEVRDEFAENWRATVLGDKLLVRTDGFRVSFRLHDLGTGKEVSRVSAARFTRFSGLAWAKTGSALAWADSDRPFDNTDVKPTAALDLAALAPPAKIPADARFRALEWGNVTLDQRDYSASVSVMGQPVKLAYEAEYDFETIVHGTLVGPKHAVLACTTGLFGYDTATGARTTNYKPFDSAYKVSPSPDGRYFAACAHLHPVISMFRVGAPDPVLFVVPLGAEWVAWTPGGAWDASAGGAKLAGKMQDRGAGKLPAFVPFDAKLRDAEKVKAALK
jgi:WD40 repeat protein